MSKFKKRRPVVAVSGKAKDTFQHRGLVVEQPAAYWASAITVALLPFSYANTQQLNNFVLSPFHTQNLDLLFPLTLKRNRLQSKLSILGLSVLWKQPSPAPATAKTMLRDAATKMTFADNACASFSPAMAVHFAVCLLSS